MFIILLAAATVGVDYGWQPRAGGGFEYIIQVEPETLQSLGRGEDIVSDIPPYLRDVRSYRITVGTGDVPRLGTPPVSTEVEPPPAEPKLPPAVEPEAPQTFEASEALSEGPPPQFRPGPVHDQGQWQSRTNVEANERVAPPVETPTYEPPDVTPQPALQFPELPSYEPPVVSPPEYEPPTPRESPYLPPVIEPGAGASSEPPVEESTYAAEPPQLPFIAESREMTAEAASFEPNTGDNRTAAKVSVQTSDSEELVQSSAETAAEKKLWWPLAASLVGLCLSLGGNVYLGWLTVAFRSRYRQVARRLRSLTGGNATVVEQESSLRWG